MDKYPFIEKGSIPKPEGKQYSMCRKKKRSYRLFIRWKSSGLSLLSCQAMGRIMHRLISTIRGTRNRNRKLDNGWQIGFILLSVILVKDMQMIQICWKHWAHYSLSFFRDIEYYADDVVCLDGGVGKVLRELCETQNHLHILRKTSWKFHEVQQGPGMKVNLIIWCLSENYLRGSLATWTFPSPCPQSSAEHHVSKAAL